MTADSILEAAQRLRDDAWGLVQAAANQAGDATVQAQEAGVLEAERMALLASAGSGPAHQLLVEAGPYLSAVTAAVPTPSNGDLLEEAERLSESVFAVALAVGEQRVDTTEARHKAAEFRTAIDTLLQGVTADERGSEIQRVLHDADLELTYIEMGGEAPTSLRVAHQLRHA